MVKYFGDAHHGQLMLQESNEVSFVGFNPMVGLMMAISFLWLLIGSCCLIWKISAINKRINGIKWPEVQEPVYLPDSNLVMTAEKYANRAVMTPTTTGVRLWTLPKPKKGMWIHMIYGGTGVQASHGNEILAKAGTTLERGSIRPVDTNTALLVAGKKIKLDAANDSVDIWFYGLSETRWVVTGEANPVVTVPVR